MIHVGTSSCHGSDEVSESDGSFGVDRSMMVIVVSVFVMGSW